MKITYIGHAAILVESRGVTVLSDPWWRGPCFGAQWWIYPEPHLVPLTETKPDYIYISHGHEDHLHFGTLNLFSRSTRVLVSAGGRLADVIRQRGFEVSEVLEHEVLDLGGGLACRIVPTYGGDTFMTLTDGKETLVNLNDAIHALPTRTRKRFINRIRREHPIIDYVFCGHGVASHFPNCYVIPGKDREKTARQRQLFFNESWAHIIKELAPHYGFPFAADVVLLDEKLRWANEPVHNTERPPTVFARKYSGTSTTVLDIAPGCVVRDGNVDQLRLKSKLCNNDLDTTYRDKIARANYYRAVTADGLRQVEALLEQNIERHREYLGTFAGDYRVLFCFHNSDKAFAVVKRGDRLKVHTVAVPAEPVKDSDLIYTTRLSYLRRSLTTRFGAETLFVGSGGVFEYSEATQVARNIHEEVTVMVSMGGPSASRRRKNIKKFIKGIVNRSEFDLYNLNRWTIYAGTR